MLNKPVFLNCVGSVRKIVLTARSARYRGRNRLAQTIAVEGIYQLPQLSPRGDSELSFAFDGRVVGHAPAIWSDHKPHRGLELRGAGNDDSGAKGLASHWQLHLRPILRRLGAGTILYGNGAWVLAEGRGSRVRS